MRSIFKVAGVAAALSIALAGCAGPAAEPSASGPAVDNEAALGSADVIAAMDELYKSAVDAGETTITVYGPGESDKQAIYDSLFSQRYPEIKVTGVQVAGPDYAAKLEAEFASGQHVADLVQAGDTSIASNLKTDYIEAFTPANADTLNAEKWSDGNGFVWAPSAAAFGYLYNTNLVNEAAAPQGWKDLLDDVLVGKMTSEDATKNGPAFGTLNHLMADGRLGEDYITGLAAQNITFQAATPAAGNTVATGEYMVEPFYPMSFYMNDKAKGAPVEFVFPTEDGVHLSGHFLGVVKGAKNPNAAKLLMTWLLTPEAQVAQAELGYYPLVDGQAGPAGNPPAEELDLLATIPLADLNAVASANMVLVKAAFGE